jgi:hypothetical protein
VDDDSPGILTAQHCWHLQQATAVYTSFAEVLLHLHLEQAMSVGPGMDRRWGVRVQVNTPAALRGVYGIEMPVSIRDVSLSGACVGTIERPPLLSRVAVRANGNAREWMEACVTRIHDGGIGIEWLEPGSQLALSLVSMAHSIRMPVETEMQEQALARARSEVESGEFDVQG